MTHDEAKYKAAAARDHLSKATAALRELQDAGFHVQIVDTLVHPDARSSGDFLRMAQHTTLGVIAERTVSYTEEV